MVLESDIYRGRNWKGSRAVLVLELCDDGCSTAVLGRLRQLSTISTGRYEESLIKHDNYKLAMRYNCTVSMYHDGQPLFVARSAFVLCLKFRAYL